MIPDSFWNLFTGCGFCTFVAMLFTDTYKTIAAASEGIYREKASKFLAFAFPVSHEEQVKEQLQTLRKLHFSANHHCYAYVLGYDHAAFRMNDDGEPSGTAGRPIYGQILSHDLTNILIVVVRYFGGTKLGVSGLINAYKISAQEAIRNAEILEKQVYDVYSITYPYGQMNTIMRLVKEEEWDILHTDFNLECVIELKIRKSRIEHFAGKLKRLDGVKYTYLYTI